MSNRKSSQPPNQKGRGSKNDKGDGPGGPKTAAVPLAERETLKDLVIYNERGQATIDINRLIYRPKGKKKEKKDEKLSSYLPDYLIIIFNFLCLPYATYYLINGITIISWRNTMQMFSVDQCEDPNNENLYICKSIKRYYPDKDAKPYTILRFYAFADISTHGVLLFVSGLANFANVIIGINAGIDGSYPLMVFHLIADGVLIVWEVVLVTIIALSGTCDTKDIEIIREFLQRHVENYALVGSSEDFVRKETMELDAIQLSLTCCGVGNWTDFLPLSIWSDSGILEERVHTPRFNLDNSDMVIPYSCCRQWWVRNLYCAQQAHLWAYPTVTPLKAHRFRQRISQWGCLPKIVGLCNNMIIMGGTGGAVAWAIHVFLSIVRHFCGIALIERGKRPDAGKEGKGNDGGLDLTTSDPKAKRNGVPGGGNDDEDEDDLPALPRDNDLAYMKSMRNFNIMRSAMKNTHMDDWMQKGKVFVEGDNNVDRRGRNSRQQKWEDFDSNELRNRGKPTRQMGQQDFSKPQVKKNAYPERNAVYAAKMINNMANN